MTIILILIIPVTMIIRIAIIIRTLIIVSILDTNNANNIRHYYTIVDRGHLYIVYYSDWIILMIILIVMIIVII